MASSLKSAAEQYAKDPSQDHFRSVLQALLMEAWDGKMVHVPFSVERDDFYYRLIDCSDGKAYYAVCTDNEQMKKGAVISSAAIAVADILNKLPSQPEIGGICVNPWDKTPCFVPTELIRRLMEAMRGT